MSGTVSGASKDETVTLARKMSVITLSANSKNINCRKSLISSEVSGKTDYLSLDPY